MVNEWRGVVDKSGKKLGIAILNIIATGHLTLPDRYVDVTIRCPMAESALPKAAWCAGVALQMGVDKKEERYPP